MTATIRFARLLKAVAQGETLQPPGTAPALSASLGEGQHTRPDGSRFLVTWWSRSATDPTLILTAGWYWIDLQSDGEYDGDWSSAFQTDHAAYLAAMELDA